MVWPVPAICARLFNNQPATPAPPSSTSSRTMNMRTNHSTHGGHGSSFSAARSTVATTAVMIPALLAIGAMTWVYDLYSYRRRYSRSPAYHPSILLRPSPATTSLSDSANRIFNVRADRNILASGLLDHCHFSAEVLEEQSTLICKLPRSRMKHMLEYFVGIKKECDRAQGLRSPLPYDTPDIPAQAIEREWVQRCCGGLQAAAKAAALDPEMAREMDTGGSFEVWQVLMRNRCRGWVVEPYHLEMNSLDDDDEMPFTWTNGKQKELMVFPGRWPKKGVTQFNSLTRRVRPPLPMRRRSTGGSGGMGGIRSPRIGAGEWGAVNGVGGGGGGGGGGLGVGDANHGWESIDGTRAVDSMGPRPWGSPLAMGGSRWGDESSNRPLAGWEGRNRYN